MTLPRLTVYNEISVDGRIEGFAGDGIRYYRRGFRWHSDAILMGSVTALSFGAPETAAETIGPGPRIDPVPVAPGFEDVVHVPRPLLVVVDSRGRVRNWRHAQAQPWYRSCVALVSERTPREYVDHLARRGVEHVRAGEDRVDLPAALDQLHERFGVESARTDGGGALTGALLSAGVVDDLVVIVEPVLSGKAGARSLVDLSADLPAAVDLRLTEVERLDDGAMWLGYEVVRSSGSLE